MANSDKRIVYTNDEGKLCIIIPSDNCGLTVEEIPAHNHQMQTAGSHNHDSIVFNPGEAGYGFATQSFYDGSNSMNFAGDHTHNIENTGDKRTLKPGVGCENSATTNRKLLIPLMKTLKDGDRLLDDKAKQKYKCFVIEIFFRYKEYLSYKKDKHTDLGLI